MRTYLIDGFNVFHQIDALRGANPPREALLRYISANHLTGSGNNKVIVVFDGHDVGLVESTPFTVLFSDDGTADDVIKEKIKAHSAHDELIVVSNDNEIRSCAKVHAKTVWSVEKFLSSGVTSSAGSRLAKAKRQKKHANEKRIDPVVARKIDEEFKKLWGKK